MSTQAKHYGIMRQNLRAVRRLGCPTQWEVPLQITDAEGQSGGNVIAIVYSYEGEDDCLEIAKALISFARLESEKAELLAFIEKWRGIIDGGSKTAEGWAKEFDTEARAAIAKAKANA